MYDIKRSLYEFSALLIALTVTFCSNFEILWCFLSFKFHLNYVASSVMKKFLLFANHQPKLNSFLFVMDYKL